MSLVAPDVAVRFVKIGRTLQRALLRVAAARGRRSIGQRGLATALRREHRERPVWDELTFAAQRTTGTERDGTVVREIRGDDGRQPIVLKNSS